MKTAEEWMYQFGRVPAEQLPDRVLKGISEIALPKVQFYQSILSENDVEAIQLDAFKAGMEFAAKVITSKPVVHIAMGSFTGRNAILTAAQNLKEIPK